MTHFLRLESDQIKNISEKQYVLLKAKETYKEGETFILQSTNADEEETWQISGITHSVDGLLKGWIIVSIKEKS